MAGFDPPPGYEHVTPEMCLSCKGAKALCGKPCFLLSQIDRRLPQLRITNADVQGPSPPGLFIGRYGYPRVAAGPMLPPLDLPRETMARMDDPAQWTQGGIQDVLGLRSSLLRTARPQRVTGASNPDRFLQLTQELAMSVRPVDTEVRLTRTPNLKMTAQVGDITSPMGPRLEARQARFTEHVRVARPVERLVADTDAKASTAMTELDRAGFATHHIERLLSVGVLGQGRRRRLVPTRWSITATDDTLGKNLIPGVMDHPTLDEVEVYRATLHGNEFHIMLVPTVWSFDMVETWLKGAMWALEDSGFITDWEDHRGRTRYASNITGAYYAARLSVLRHLNARRRQAAAFVYREITPDYWAPLGVWLIREAVRKALEGKPAKFESVRQGVEDMRTRTRRKDWPAASHLLDEVLRQRRLNEYV